MEEALVEVWRGALVDGAAEVELDGQRFPVRETLRKQLREVDFVFEGQPLRGLEHCAGWNKIRRQNRVGRNWRKRDTK